MASSTLQFLSQTTTLHLNLSHPNKTIHTFSYPSPFPLTHLKHNLTSIIPKCTTNSSSLSTPEPADNFPTPSREFEATNPAEQFPIEKRRRSEIIRDRKIQTRIVKPDPPNFEIGWKRTNPINLEKPTGYVIMDFLDKLDGLMGREFGSTELLAKTGEIVAERVREEAEILRDEGKVEDRMVNELFRVLKLMEMDLAMVKAAVKEETLNQRIEQAKARCRQAILVAKSF
ncbi:protein CHLORORESPIRATORY REDUCTION 41, chloroplastic [Amaranthus tricolor]|uniref:protein CHLORORESPIRATORY REDUCTION 41, chloroplastic n=1 Tax=Amaranthus tricolor TaxID=29722 RepID=UPI002583A84D|nr:protein CHLORORESPIRATORY REDUCTION 41, chloroplastic [Amaranthus tricolor]